MVLDGAMGTMIQRHKLEEKDFRGERLKDHPHPLKGNNDCCASPDQTSSRKFIDSILKRVPILLRPILLAATSVAQADYHLEFLVYDLNYQGAKIAKEVADEFTKKEPSKPRFVAGSMGPTTKLASMSPDVNNPAIVPSRLINW